MGRPKKDYQATSIRLDTQLFDRLTKFCEDSGQSKTTAIERAIAMYIDDYDEKMKRLNQEK